jgi:hypothetical protein
MVTETNGPSLQPLIRQQKRLSSEFCRTNKQVEALTQCRMAQVPGWTVVVVGDTKTPADWKQDNCHFLAFSEQGNLGYRVTALLPERHYGRKNIGYVYAIEHGAKVIYEVDDDNILEVATLPVHELQSRMSVYATERETVNPYAYFGIPEMWPRGYPLANIQWNPEYHFTTDTVNPLSQQSLANGDPGTWFDFHFGLLAR